MKSDDTYVTQSEDNVLGRCLIPGQITDDGVKLEVGEVGVGASSECDVDETGDGETEAGGCCLRYAGLYLIFQHHKVVCDIDITLPADPRDKWEESCKTRTILSLIDDKVSIKHCFE